MDNKAAFGYHCYATEEVVLGDSFAVAEEAQVQFDSVGGHPLD